MATWPATLPDCPLASFVQRPQGGLLRSDGGGTARHKRRFREVLIQADVTWCMTSEELAIFKAWYISDAVTCGSYFSIDLKLDVDTPRTVQARFSSDKQVTFTPMGSADLYSVDASLEIIDSGS
jgi:hypothetical protein